MLILLIFFTLNVKSQNQTMQNGIYLMEYNSPTKNSNKLVLRDSLYVLYTENDTISNRIFWISKRKFILKDCYNTELGKTLTNSFGDICYEITDIKNGRFSFKPYYTGQLHITLTDGIFVPLNLK